MNPDDTLTTAHVRLGPAPHGLRTAAWVLIGVAVFGAGLSVLGSVLGSQMKHSDWLSVAAAWLPWLPYAAFSAYFAARVFIRTSLEFSSDGVTRRSAFSSIHIRWSDVDRLYALRTFRGQAQEPFPAAIALDASRPGMSAGGAARRPSLAVQPGRMDSVDLVRTALSQLVAGVAPEWTDPEVILMLALCDRVIEWSSARAHDAIAALDPHDAVVARLLREPTGVEAVAAPFEYFLGHFGKAQAQCAAGLAREPGSWDLLLCRALCERALGDLEKSRGSLSAALDASTPVVARVLSIAYRAA